MSELNTPQDHETCARQASVNIAQAFRMAARKTAWQNFGIVGLTFAAATVSVYKEPALLLPTTVLSSAAAVVSVRRKQQEMRDNLKDIMETVPSTAQGIVYTELKDLDKALNTGKLEFGKKDLNLRQHSFKYMCSGIVGMVAPGFMPAQYMLMLAGDEMHRLRAVDQTATAIITRNTPKP